MEASRAPVVPLAVATAKAEERASRKAEGTAGVVRVWVTLEQVMVVVTTTL